MGVTGGLPLMILFIMVLMAAFSAVGGAMREKAGASTEYCFLIWTLGAILFGHIWNFFTITLFDQSIVFFYLVLSCIGAVQVSKSFVKIKPIHQVGRFTQSRYVRVEGINQLFSNSCEALPLNRAPIQSFVKYTIIGCPSPESDRKCTQL
jgi:hypothetical protein